MLFSIPQNELHINIGGGRDNIIRYNVFYNATNAAVGIDARGKDKVNSATLVQRLKVNKQFVLNQCMRGKSRYTNTMHVYLGRSHFATTMLFFSHNAHSVTDPRYEMEIVDCFCMKPLAGGI